MLNFLRCSSLGFVNQSTFLIIINNVHSEWFNLLLIMSPSCSHIRQRRVSWDSLRRWSKCLRVPYSEDALESLLQGSEHSLDDKLPLDSKFQLFTQRLLVIKGNLFIFDSNLSIECCCPLLEEEEVWTEGFALPDWGAYHKVHQIRVRQHISRVCLCVHMWVVSYVFTCELWVICSHVSLQQTEELLL